MGNKENKRRAVFFGFSTPNTTATPDEFFDIVLAEVDTLSELKVIAYTIRRTYGFKKAQDWISNDQYVNGIVKKDGTRLDSGTGLSSPSVSDGLKRAVEHGYMVRSAQCPLCDAVVSEREKITVKFKNRHSGEVRDIEKDVVPRNCSSCREKLRGRERMVYGLKLASTQGYLKSLDRGNQDSLLGVSKSFRTQHTDVQETVIQNNVHVASNKNEAIPSNGTSPDPRLEDVITRMAERLGDQKQGSRIAFHRIVDVLGESITERLVGNTLEAYQAGTISSTRAKYFMGMAKKVAGELQKDLGFKSKGSPTSGLTKPEQTSIHAQIATLTAEMGVNGNGSTADMQIPAENGQALTQMFEAYQRRQGRG